MNDEFNQAAQHGAPLILGMVDRLVADVRKMTPERWKDQLIGAMGSAVLISAAAYLLDVPTGKDMDKVFALIEAQRTKAENAEKANREEAERRRKHEIEDAKEFGQLKQAQTDLEKRVDIHRGDINVLQSERQKRR